MPTHRSTIDIASPIETVYQFHRVPSNFALITPPGTKVRVEPGPDEQVTLFLTRFGITQRLVVRFIVIDPPNLLVDEQIDGPFRHWRQTRRFETLPDGGTRLVDEVEFELGYGFLGRLLERLIVVPQLEKMFSYRQKMLKKLLES